MVAVAGVVVAGAGCPRAIGVAINDGWGVGCGIDDSVRQRGRGAEEQIRGRCVLNLSAYCEQQHGDGQSCSD